MLFPSAIRENFSEFQDIQGNSYKLINEGALTRVVDLYKKQGRSKEILPLLDQGLATRFSAWLWLARSTCMRVSITNDRFFETIRNSSEDQVLAPFRLESSLAKDYLNDLAQSMGFSSTGDHFDSKRPPWLHFDCSPAASRYVFTLFDWVKTPSSGKPKEREKKLKSLVNAKQELIDQDRIEPNYFDFLAHALGFLFTGNAVAAVTLCESAISWVSNIPHEQRNKVEGREAHYLKSLCLRRLANAAPALDFAREELQKAILRDKLDLEPAFRRCSSKFEFDPRFHSEAIAIDFYKLQFALKNSTGSGVLGKHAQQWRSLRESAYELFAEVQACRDVLTKLCTVIDGESLDTNNDNLRSGEGYYDWLITQTSINVINLELCLGLDITWTNAINQNFVEDSKLRTSRACEQLELVIETSDSKNSNFQQSMLLFGRLWAGTSQYDKEGLNSIRTSSNAYPLDKWRLEKYKSHARLWAKAQASSDI